MICSIGPSLLCCAYDAALSYSIVLDKRQYGMVPEESLGICQYSHLEECLFYTTLSCTGSIIAAAGSNLEVHMVPVPNLSDYRDRYDTVL